MSVRSDGGGVVAQGEIGGAEIALSSALAFDVAYRLGRE